MAVVRYVVVGGPRRRVPRHRKARPLVGNLDVGHRTGRRQGSRGRVAPGARTRRVPCPHPHGVGGVAVDAVVVPVPAVLGNGQTGTRPVPRAPGVDTGVVAVVRYVVVGGPRRRVPRHREVAAVVGDRDVRDRDRWNGRGRLHGHAGRRGAAVAATRDGVGNRRGADGFTADRHRLRRIPVG